MSQKDILLYLMTIAECIEKIFIYSHKLDSSDDFLWANNQMNFNVCTNLLIAIGEDSRKLIPNLKNDFRNFPGKILLE